MQKGQKHTPEARAKIAAYSRNRSVEHRLNLSLAARRRWGWVQEGEHLVWREKLGV